MNLVTGFIPCGPYEINAAAPRVVENFLDLSHPPILHDGILGDSSHAAIDDYHVEDTEEGFFVKNVRYYQPDPDGTGVGGDAWYDFGILAPLTVYFVKHIGTPGNKEKFVLMFAVRPETENKSWAHFIAAYNYAADLSEQEIADFHSLIIGQDIPHTRIPAPRIIARGPERRTALALGFIYLEVPATLKRHRHGFWSSVTCIYPPATQSQQIILPVAVFLKMTGISWLVSGTR